MDSITSPFGFDMNDARFSWETVTDLTQKMLVFSVWFAFAGDLVLLVFSCQLCVLSTELANQKNL